MADCPCCNDPDKHSALWWSKKGKTRQLCEAHKDEQREERRLIAIDRQTRKDMPPAKKVRHCAWCGRELPESTPKKEKTCDRGECQDMLYKPGEFDRMRPEWHSVVYGGRKTTSRT